MGRKRKRRRAPDAGAYQAPAEPALAPARPIIFRFRRWMQFEPDPKYRQRDDPSPLAYVRTWINEDRIGGTVTRLEIMQSRRAILNAGGPKLYGMYRLLVEYSADLRFLRGYMADHMGQPAGPETIAGTMGCDPLDAAWALRLLADPALAVLEACDWQTVYRTALETDRAAAAALGLLPGPQRAGPNESAAMAKGEPPPDPAAPTAEQPQGAAICRPDADAEQQRHIAEARAGPARAATRGPPARHGGRGNYNGNGNAPAGAGANRAAPSTAASAATRQRETKTQTAKANGERPTCPGAPGPTGMETGTGTGISGDAGGNGDAAPTGTPTPPADNAAASRPPTEADPRQDATGQTRRACPGRPVCPGDEDAEVVIDEFDEDLWRQLEPVTTWEKIVADADGVEFGKAVYFLLGYPLGASVRGVRREVRAFAGRWATAMAVETGDGPLPDLLLLDLAQRSLRHAIALASSRPRADRQQGKDGNKARIWMAEFPKRLGRLLAALADVQKNVSDCRGVGSGPPQGG